MNTGNALLDSLVISLNRQVNMLTEQSIDKLEIYADIDAQSWCTKEGIATRWLPDVVPFYSHVGKVAPAEGFVQISYQEPCDLLVSTLSVKANSRRQGKKMMQEAEKILLPIYAIHHMNRRVADRVYTLPFCNDGLDLYDFALRDTVLQSDSLLLKICFSPKKQHHALVEGFALVNPSDRRTKELNIAGRTDFGLMHDTIEFGWQNGHHVLMRNRARIDYKYGKAEGHNAYQIEYIYRQLECEPEEDAEKHEDPNTYDLTDIYTPEKTLYQYYFADSTRTIRRKKTMFQQLPQRMVGTSDIDAFGTDMRVYGPLNPASFGYDKFNGITLRERVRFSHLWSNGRSLMIRPELGYSFGLKEFRYKFDMQWVYAPQRRAGLRWIAQNGNSGFSSKFREVVNDRLDEYGEQLKEHTKQTWEEGI
ncbi:MAG: hypothetical protein K6G52_06150, partial [Treponemataceae bacterium]|nr:hypothetical protein [Treponemataceae bacterium]